MFNMPAPASGMNDISRQGFGQCRKGNLGSGLFCLFAGTAFTATPARLLVPNLGIEAFWIAVYLTDFGDAILGELLIVGLSQFLECGLIVVPGRVLLQCLSQPLQLAIEPGAYQAHVMGAEVQRPQYCFKGICQSRGPTRLVPCRTVGQF